MPSREKRAGGRGGAVRVWGLRRNCGRRMKGRLSSTDLRKTWRYEANCRNRQMERRRSVEEKDTVFLWRESRSHNDLITDANAGPSKAGAEMLYLKQSISQALGFRPFTFYLWCLSVVGLSVFVCTVHFLGSNKEPINRVLPRSPEQVAGTARRNSAQIHRHTHMHDGSSRSRVCLAKHGRHPRGLQRVWTGQWWDQF